MVFAALIMAMSSAAANTFQVEPVYHAYGSKDGLPTGVNLFQSLVDSRGYVWFCSSAGISRFDGYGFKNFDFEEGLTDRLVLRLFEDDRQRVWAYSLSGDLFYFEDNRFHTYAYNEQLKALLEGDMLASFHLDSSGVLHVGHYTKGYYTISSEGKLEHLISADNGRMGIGLILLDDTVPFCFSLFQVGADFRAQGTVTWYDHDLHPDYAFSIYDDTEEFLRYARTTRFIQRKNGEFLISYNDRVVHFSRNEVISRFKQDSRVIWLFEDSRQAVWVGMMDGGVEYIPSIASQGKPHRHYFGQMSISSIAEDSESGIWLTSVEDGVKHLPLHGFDAVTWDGATDFVNQFTSLEVGKDSTLYFGTSDLQLVCVHGGKQTLLDPTMGEQLVPRSRFGDMLFDTASNELWITSVDHVIVYDGIRFDTIDRSGFSAGRGLLRSIAKDDFRGCYWVGSHNRFFQVRDKAIVAEHVAQVGKIYTLLVAQDKVWLGCDNGLFYFDGKHVLPANAGDPQLSDRVMGMTFYRGLLWLGTFNSGLLTFDTARLATAAQRVGLHKDVFSFSVYDGDLWFKSNLGLNRLHCEADRNKVATMPLSTFDALSANADLAVIGHTLLIQRIGSVHALDMSDFHPRKSNIPLCFEEVMINNHDTVIQSSYMLDYDQNFIRIKYLGISCRTKGNVTYRYKLEGIDPDWIETSDQKVQYTTLPAGHYTFRLYAKAEGGLWSDMPAQLSFVIAPPYWKTWWFLTLLAMSVSGLMGFLTLYRIRHIEAQNQMELALLRSQLSALSAQLNPHFLFNAMNSIHNYIRKNDKEQSSEYLLRFSKLLRQILQNAREPLISISQELDLVDKYLQVEQIRFKERMTYKIEVDEVINTEDWKIPSQLIQPYVENAIWHGLLHKDVAGYVHIKLHLNGADLICEVEDDGIGREASMAFKEQNNQHESFGMRLGNERLSLVRAFYKRPVAVNVIDLKDENGTATGTKVIITLPIINE